MSSRRVLLSSASSAGGARTMHAETDREYIVPILMKSIAILNLLRATPEGMKIDQIHQATGIARSTVYRIIRTLLASGYVRATGDYTYRVA
jgi:ribose transport system substrate-binding protein